MSGQVEYYVGMRVIAQGREGTISRVLNSGYDVSFPDGQVAHNLPAASITPFDTAPVAKQIGGPPSVGAPGGGGGEVLLNNFMYPPGSQPQQQPLPVQGVYSLPVVHNVTATPVSVSSTPVYLNIANNSQNRAEKVPGFEFSPDVGAPFGELGDCDGTCVMACCCPCIVGGQVAQRLGLNSFGIVCCCYVTACIILFIISVLLRNFAIYLLLWISWSIYVLVLRLRTKRKWQQPDSDCCEDCCISFCCLSCSLAQVSYSRNPRSVWKLQF